MILKTIWSSIIHKIKQLHALPWVFFVKKSSFLNFTLNILDDRAVVVDFFDISFSEDGTLTIIDFMSGKLFSEWLKF